MGRLFTNKHALLLRCRDDAQYATCWRGRLCCHRGGPGSRRSRKHCGRPLLTPLTSMMKTSTMTSSARVRWVVEADFFQPLVRSPLVAAHLRVTVRNSARARWVAVVDSCRLKARSL